MSILTAEYSFDAAMAVKQEEAYAKGLSIGLQRGVHQKALETAKAFLFMGLSPEQVAQGTSLPLDVVQGLMKSQ